MAENLIDFMKQLEESEPPCFTPPQIYYGPREDCLTCYFRSDESYAHRLNDLVTVFLSFDRNELVGCQVKGLQQRLKNDGEFWVQINKGGKLKLGLFFHLLAYDIPEEEPRNRLVELGQKAKDVEVDPKELMASPC
jgi:hypothetical protein